MSQFKARYGLTMRPPMPGALPKKGLLETKAIEGYAPDGRHCWGWADYDRKLTDEEVRDYELTYIESHYEYTEV